MRRRQKDRGRHKWRKREDISCVGERECKTEADTESMHGNEEGEASQGEYDRIVCEVSDNTGYMRTMRTTE